MNDEHKNAQDGPPEEAAAGQAREQSSLEEGAVAEEGGAGSAPRSGRAAVVIAAAALIVALGAFAAGYLAWQRIGAAQRAADGRLARVEQSLGATAAALESGLAEVKDSLGRDLERRVAEVQAAVEALRGEQRRAGAWEPAEVEYLLRLANDTLQLKGDVDGALLALAAADRRLLELHDPAFAETRRRLASEIAALQAVERPDISGMAFLLAGLQERLDALPFAPAGTETAPEPGAAAPERSGWRRMLSDVWSALRDLVTVRRQGASDAPLLRPEQREFLLLNLRLKLETARLALLRLDGRNFHGAIAAARAWVERYFDTDSTPVQSLVDSLNRLDAVDLAPPHPEISGSLAALRQVLAARLGPPAAPDGETR